MKISCIIQVALCLALSFTAVSAIFGDSDDMPTASKARDVRAAARKHYKRANDAEEMMHIAEDKDDVDSYEKWLQIMRDEDARLLEKVSEYFEIRDYLEARIWSGELEIDGFKKLYQDGTLKSIIKRIAFKAKD